MRGYWILTLCIFLCVNESLTGLFFKANIKIVSQHESTVGSGLTQSLQRHNTENSKRICPRKEQRGYIPSFYIHVSVSDRYIPLIGPPILLHKNRWAVRRNTDCSQTNECGNCDCKAAQFLFWEYIKSNIFAVICMCKKKR
jgi:hypothetical protein